MTINSAGWIDWAEDYWGPENKVNGGDNPVKGVFLHSAEGYESTILNLINNGPNSWHASVMFDGRCYQHYSLRDQCWHATAANNEYVGIEFEGRVPTDPTLTPAQVSTAKRLIADISAWRGWTPKRPTSSVDKSHTLWEHKEVIRLGGSATACPSGRIPWSVILSPAPQPQPPGPGDLRVEGFFTVLYNGGVPVWRWGSTDGHFPGRISKNFGGTWWWLRNGFTMSNNAYWSLEEGD